MRTTISEFPDDLDVKAISGALSIDEAKGIVECFAAAFGNKDSVGDIIVPGAFDASLRRRRPRVVWGHDWNHPIGKVLDIYEVAPGDPRLPAKMKQAGVGGLYVRVQFNLKSEKGRDAFQNVVFFGEDQEWSIGYKTLDSIYDNAKQANILRELELYEVSPVLHGANQLTATISIKSENQEQLKSFRASKWKTFDPEFAEMIRREHPDIWRLGGNIKGNDQFRKLYPITQRGGTANSEAEMNALELREAWVARHFKDFRLPGVIAQIKWLAVGSRGESYMKSLVREAIAAKESPEEKGMDISPAMLMRVIEALREADDEDEDENEGEGEDKGNFKNPCWPGYEMVGMKPGDNGEMVPNCVPIKSVSGYEEEGETMEKLVPADAIPQERFTGDVLRGYGPRRGNLERLLRYWRPIMRREGGFRRCRVILADHPELFPLNNICAWLHHETTGLWPNEGCHHPGMKNCRRKLRGVTNGSLWNDSEWESRLRRIGGKKDGWPDGAATQDEDMEDVVTDEDIRYANQVLAEFLKSEPELLKMLSDESNWEHEGMNESGDWEPHRQKEPGGCGCGCGSKAATQEEKAGRVLNASNMSKVQQALALLQEVVASASQADITVKYVAALEQEIKSFVKPIEDFYKVELNVSDYTVSVDNALSGEVKAAIDNALASFDQQAEYLIVDVEPEQMFDIKQLFDSVSDSGAIIDENEGSWIAVKTDNGNSHLYVAALQASGIKVKGLAFGEMESN
jgi:HK97 family phage prohead protease